MDEISLDRYFLEQSGRRPPYADQLAPAFQQALARHFADIAVADCAFTESIDLPSGETLAGDLDLRGMEDAYLAGARFWGMRVLQVKPGSGWLSAHIAIRADELVTIDTPLAPADAAGGDAEGRIRRGWWFARNALGYDARAVYADPCDPPDDLGRFDTAILAGALPGLAHPDLALRRIAALVDDAIVVTGPSAGLPPDLGALPVALLVDRPQDQGGPHLSLTVTALGRLLAGLGFAEQAVSHVVPRGSSGWHWTLHARRKGKVPAPVPPAVAAMPEPIAATTQAPPPPPGPRTGQSAASAFAPPLAAVHDNAPGAQTAAAASAFLASIPPPAPSAAFEDPADTLPLPPPQQRHLVAGTTDVEAFVSLGRVGFMAIIGSLERARIDTRGLHRVLDFGCGVGRVLRYWHGRPGLEVFGTDLHAEAIAWCQDNLTFAQFACNGLDPRLDYPDGFFGFVYALSVFTHLPETMQRPWLVELIRIVRPGGHLYLTTHGNAYRPLMPPAWRERYDRGELIVGGGDDAGSNICSAFHPPEYFRREMLQPSGAEVVEFLPEGAAGNPRQDSWLIRKL